MQKKPLSTHPIETPTYSAHIPLLPFLVDALKKHPPQEGSIVALTSKVVSVAEGRIVPRDSISKTELIRREADVDLGDIALGVRLTIKEGLMIPSAGIDESNSQTGDYLLFPEKPFESARRIWSGLREAFGLENLGVLLTDSRTQPLRWGVTGIALSYWGFDAVESLIGRNDLFGRPLRMTKVNIADALAATAVLMMGESDDSTPLAVIDGARVRFNERPDRSELQIPLEQDLYYPLIERAMDSEERLSDGFPL